MTDEPIKNAYLIRGLQSCGKTTLGRERAAAEGGVCISFDDFFFKVVNPKEPEVFNFKPERMQSAIRWFWLKLKQACDKGTTPIYVDQMHIWNKHTWNTAGFLAYRYGYKVSIVEPDHPLWLKARPLLEVMPPEARDHDKLLSVAQEMVDASDKGITLKSVVWYMEWWRDFTMEDLMEEY